MSNHFEVVTEFDSTSGDSQSMRCRRLWGAVLIQAVRDYDAVRRNAVPTVGSAYWFNGHKLKRWFESTEVKVSSFAWICLLLDLNPEVIRSRLDTNSHFAAGVRK